MPEPGRLTNVRYISIAETTQRKIGGFTLDPDILLPVELPEGATSMKPDELRWEAIVAGALKVLAWDPSNVNSDYYRSFVLAVKPDIKSEFTSIGILKARNGEADVAIEIFLALEGLFPQDAVTQMNLALVYEERGRQLEKLEDEEKAEEMQGLAFEAYKAALAADPAEPTIHYNVAYFYLHQRSFEKAREHLEFYVKTADDEKRVREARRIIREIDEQGLMDGLFKKAFDSIHLGKEEEAIVAHHEVPLFPTAGPQRLVPPGLGAAQAGPLRGGQGGVPEGPGGRLGPCGPSERAGDLSHGAR